MKRSGERISFAAKATGPESKDSFTWGYMVKKGAYEIEIFFEDALDKRIFSGFYPPELEDFLAKGWEPVKKEGMREDLGLCRCAACRWLCKEKDQKTPFESFPEDWKCPVCKTGKGSFEKVA